jgi:predicted AAA+ superfamily ATPase
MNQKRMLDIKLREHFNNYKEVLVLLGARQVGKTTILKKIFPQAQYLSVDTLPVREVLNRYDPNVYRQIFQPGTELIVIDEIHKLSDPGLAAKIIYDQISEHKLIITGSSAFNIKNKASESLAGRKIEYHLYPLTFSEYLVQKEIASEFSNLFLDKFETEKYYPFDLPALLDNVLIYGLYPEIIARPSDSLYLTNLVDSVVFKDLLDLSLIENREGALNLLKLLAHQIGSLVNYSELASRLGMDVKTIKRYINLFEKSFIIFSLLPYSTKKRDEIGKSPKIYFYDLGLRNALIENFQTISNRVDGGHLFENFIISEVLKTNYFRDFGYHLNYWRTKQGSEIDLVLSKSDGELRGIEIKLSGKIGGKAFANRYPQAKIITVNKQNFYQ